MTMFTRGKTISSAIGAGQPARGKIFQNGMTTSAMKIKKKKKWKIENPIMASTPQGFGGMVPAAFSSPGST